MNLVRWRKDFTSNEELTKLGNEAEALKMKLDEIRVNYEAAIKEIGIHRTELDEKFETRAKLNHELDSVTETSMKQEKEDAWLFDQQVAILLLMLLLLIMSNVLLYWLKQRLT